MKHCKKCGQDKPVDQFYAHARTKDGYGTYCKSCQSNYNRERNHKVSPEIFQMMLVSQRGECAACGDHMDDPQVDHCHERDKNRGLLCKPCNLGLGQFKDDPVRLSKAIIYITERHAMLDGTK